MTPQERAKFMFEYVYARTEGKLHTRNICFLSIDFFISKSKDEESIKYWEEVRDAITYIYKNPPKMDDPKDAEGTPLKEGDHVLYYEITEREEMVDGEICYYEGINTFFGNLYRKEDGSWYVSDVQIGNWVHNYYYDIISFDMIFKVIEGA